MDGEQAFGEAFGIQIDIQATYTVYPGLLGSHDSATES